MEEKDFANFEVAAVFSTHPEKIKNKLMLLRRLIFGIATIV
jgi:hypothetical protein